MDMTIRVITSAEIEAEKKMFSALTPDKSAGSAALTVKKDTDADKKDTLMNVLLKYIPVTVIVLYTFLDSVLRAATPAPLVLWFVCFIILIIGAFVITYWITQGPEVDIPGMTQGNMNLEKIVNDWQKAINNQRIKQSIIAVIAFAGYVMSIGGPFAVLNGWQPYYGSVALVMAVLFIAMIAHKDLLAES
jgi:fatty acid desaturase